MRSEERELRQREELFELTLVPQHEHVSFHESVTFRATSKMETGAGGLPRELGDLAVGRRKDPHAVGIGVVEESRFVGVVGVDPVVPIEMIR